MKKTDKKQEEEIVPLPEQRQIEPNEETVEEKAGEKEEEKVEEEKKNETPRQTFSQIVRRFVLAVLRLIIIVAVIGGCGALIFFGAPFLYDNFFRPVEQNASQMNDIALRQSQLEFQVVDIQTRLATLEAGQITQSGTLAEIASGLQTLEAGQTAQSESLAALEARLQTLEGADAERNDALADLTYQSDLLQAMELLSRARLFLYQSNFGLARSDVQAARNVLAEMQTAAPDSKQKDLTEAIFRLDLALKNLPDFPVAASDDLDIAWQILLEGYPVAPTATLTPFPTSTAAPIPTTTATTGTPTP